MLMNRQTQLIIIANRWNKISWFSQKQKHIKFACALKSILWRMSDPMPPSQPQKSPPIQQSTFAKYTELISSLLKSIKNFNYRLFFEDIVAFVSIIVAYQIISLSYQFNPQIEKFFQINFKEEKTITLVYFIFSIYLIFWKIISYFFQRRAEAPPPKKQDDQSEYDIPSENPIPKKEEEKPINNELHYHEIINQSLKISVYLFILLVFVTAYAYFNQPSSVKGVAKLINIEQIVYLGLWFILSNLYFLIGKIISKFSKIAGFQILGKAMGAFVIILVLGLANKFNTFIFI